MSGSSLDGLDLALGKFVFRGEALQSWRALACGSRSFSVEWSSRLRGLPQGSALDLASAHAAFGRYLGEHALDFLRPVKAPVDAIASHGHTIFHFPKAGITTQIGDGAAIAAVTGLPAIDNFRMQDVIHGGQGAPIAPVADQYLFPDFTFLLNLGGIANISAKTERGYVAFDCTGANQVLNALAGEAGLAYDEGGKLARSGCLIPELLEKALALPYHAANYPKSLGNDWVQEQLLPLYLNSEAPVADRLHTACWQIARSIRNSLADIEARETIAPPPHTLLITGGGAFNHFLTNCIRSECGKSRSLAVKIPEAPIIEYKEALLMALMGALRLKGWGNTLPSATGSSAATCGGGLHLGAPIDQAMHG